MPETRPARRIHPRTDPLRGRSLAIAVLVAISALSFTLGYFVGGAGGGTTTFDPLTVSEEERDVERVEEPYPASIGAEGDTGVAPPDGETPARVRTEREVDEPVMDVSGPASRGRTRSAGPVARAAEDNTGYTVQVAAFRSRADADALARKLKTGGYESYVHVATTASDAVPNKVRVGEVSGRVAAEALVTKLRNTHGLNGFIILLK